MVKALHSTGNRVQTRRETILRNRTGTRSQPYTERVQIEDGIEILEAGDSGTAGQPEAGNNTLDEINLIKRYQAKWPWWNDLHSIWSQRPNFNPIGIENARKGRNHVEEFHQLLDDTQLVEDSTSRENENQELRLSQRSISPMESMINTRPRRSWNSYLQTMLSTVCQ